MPNKDIENAIRSAARELRGRVAPNKLFSLLQTFFSQLEEDGNNDMASLVQASAVCQVLAEVALLNGNSVKVQ